MPENVLCMNWFIFYTLCSHVFSFSLDIDDCAKRPCQNGGRCVDKVNSYQCICKVGYNRVNCENGM